MKKKRLGCLLLVGLVLLCSCQRGQKVNAEVFLGDMMAAVSLPYGRVYAGTWPESETAFSVPARLYGMEGAEKDCVLEFALYLGADFEEINEVAVYVCRSACATETILPLCLARLAFLQKNAGASGDVRVFGSTVILAVGQKYEPILQWASRKL